MKPIEYLQIAGVPPELHAQALASLALARQRAKGLTWAKWKVRLFQARRIARLLAWEDNRLCLKHPERADQDIAPMDNITCNGDNGPWQETPLGGRPFPDCWLSPDPQSAEYQEAVAACYWCPGHHPRSEKARRAWYLRNAGEYRAWRMGVLLDDSAHLQRWQGGDVTVCRAGGAWLFLRERRLWGPLALHTRKGFEVDNVFTPSGQRGWYPAEGFDLRAPVTWSVVPARARGE